jgi:hypothetical protein
MSSQPSPQTVAQPSGDDVSTAPPVEARLVQAGKLSMGQLAQAHRDRLESGKPLLEIIVEHGWVTEAEIAELAGEKAAVPAAPVAEPADEAPAASASEPVVTPELAPEPEPAPEPERAPKPAGGQVLVGIRLTTGDLVPAGLAHDADTAATLGQAVVAELTQAAADEWPFFDGRFIKPETIVSVDLVVED